jgi:hypothetical protein
MSSSRADPEVREPKQGGERDYRPEWLDSIHEITKCDLGINVKAAPLNGAAFFRDCKKDESFVSMTTFTVIAVGGFAQRSKCHHR